MAKLAWYSTLVTSGLVMLVAACRDATTPETAQRPEESTLAAKKAPPQPPPPPPDITPPTTPVLSATDVGATHISLAWKSTDDRATSMVYVIYIDGTPNPAGTSSTSQTYYLLQPATTYTFTGKARDNSGNWSPLSEPFSVTTKPSDPNDAQAPTAPTNVWAGSYGDGSTEFEVNWTASTDNVDAQAFIRYDVYLNGAPIGSTVGTTRFTEYGVIGTNRIEVFAVDAAGNRSGAGTTTLAIQ